MFRVLIIAIVIVFNCYQFFVVIAAWGVIGNWNWNWVIKNRSNGICNQLVFYGNCHNTASIFNGQLPNDAWHLYIYNITLPM